MSRPLPETIRTDAFIDGEFVPAEGGATFSTVDPATGQPLAKVASCSAADADKAVGSARAAFERGEWRRMHPAERKAVLLRLVALMEEQRDELALVESLDSGKPIKDCRDFDLPDAINSIRWHAEAADKVFGKTSPSGEGALGLIVKEPLGVVAAVLPWNFPLAMLAWKLGPALAAGNSVVVKPPALTSLTTLRLAALATEAGLPRGVLNVVPGSGRVVGEALGTHRDVDVITFTGSNDVGRLLLRYSADSNMKRVELEMGGKSPQIVTADNADRIPTVAADLANAAFFNAGQNCTAGCRILVDSSIHDAFVEALVEETAKLTVGPPQDPQTDMGPLVEPAAVDRVESYVEGALADGATVRCGGERLLPDSGGNFYAPTVIADVRPDMAVAQEEIFGPVVAVIRFDTVDEAIEIANGTCFGLAANVWCRDIDTALRLAREVRAGTVSVNGYCEGDITTPFGGYRESGFGGRDNGVEAFDQYTETKTIYINLH